MCGVFKVLAEYLPEGTERGLTNPHLEMLISRFEPWTYGI
jgi:hypothetical protein